MLNGELDIGVKEEGEAVGRGGGIESVADSGMRREDIIDATIKNMKGGEVAGMDGIGQEIVNHGGLRE